jgi:anti-sigma factor RsiW
VRARHPLTFARSSLTIQFRTEGELRERLAGLLALFGSPAPANDVLERVEAVESCLSLIESVGIVAAALSPKAFNPPEKLGDTYLLSQERELFRARVVSGVTAAGCRIRDTDVPAGEGTTHSAAVRAVRENAHG